jgi:hypothetical protein
MLWLTIRLIIIFYYKSSRGLNMHHWCIYLFHINLTIPHLPKRSLIVMFFGLQDVSKKAERAGCGNILLMQAEKLVMRIHYS